jgi:hypothetical protein
MPAIVPGVLSFATSNRRRSPLTGISRSDPKKLEFNRPLLFTSSSSIPKKTSHVVSDKSSTEATQSHGCWPSYPCRARFWIDKCWVTHSISDLAPDANPHCYFKLEHYIPTLCFVCSDQCSGSSEKMGVGSCCSGSGRGGRCAPSRGMAREDLASDVGGGFLPFKAPA